MSYNNKEVQPELFCGIKKKKKRNLLQKKIFEDNFKASFSMPCDTLIVIVIALLMVNLTSFVIGIERGKVIAKADLSATNVEKVNKVLVEDTPSTKPESLAVNQEPEAEQEEPEEVKEVIPAPETTTKGYIIQLVTYSNNTYANREVETLRAQGHSGNVLKSGEYFVVYSGMYESKSTAKEKLTQFKKRYKDCFVRFLKNT